MLDSSDQLELVNPSIWFFFFQIFTMCLYYSLNFLCAFAIFVLPSVGTKILVHVVQVIYFDVICFVLVIAWHDQAEKKKRKAQLQEAKRKKNIKRVERKMAAVARERAWAERLKELQQLEEEKKMSAMSWQHFYGSSRVVSLMARGKTLL